jgi:hypothetical protein
MNRPPIPITAELFLKATGRAPVLDDLQRCNCEDAGTIGHWGCGWCRHRKPTFLCPECFMAAQRGEA